MHAGQLAMSSPIPAEIATSAIIISKINVRRSMLVRSSPTTKVYLAPALPFPLRKRSRSQRPAQGVR